MDPYAQGRSKYQAAMDDLDEIEARLRRMYMLASRSAEDDCTDRERASLQKRFERLSDEIDRVADCFELDVQI